MESGDNKPFPIHSTDVQPLGGDSQVLFEEKDLKSTQSTDPWVHEPVYCIPDPNILIV